MSIEKLWTKSRADRLVDPAIQTGLNAEWVRVQESFERLGCQTKETCTSVLYNTFVSPLKSLTTNHDPKKGGLSVLTNETVKGGVDSTKQVFKLVGRILMASGRVAKYGLRKALVI